MAGFGEAGGGYPGENIGATWKDQECFYSEAEIF